MDWTSILKGHCVENLSELTVLEDDLRHHSSGRFVDSTAQEYLSPGHDANICDKTVMGRQDRCGKTVSMGAASKLLVALL